MPCITEPPERSWEKHLEIMLCYACQFLDEQQLSGFRDSSGWQGIRQWYIEHLMIDLYEIENNHFKDIISAGILCKCGTLKAIFHEEEVIKKYKNHLIQELKRLGQSVRIEKNNDGSVSVRVEG